MCSPPPPSRYRWVVLAAAFMAQLIAGNANYHTGVLYVLLLQTPGVDPAVVTWLASYYAGAFALTAPVASLFINLTNCRTCVVMSGILCLVGFAISSVITTNIPGLFAALTLVGLGQAMSNTGSLVAVSYYFRDKTSIASGVCLAGGALSIFVHPPLLQELARVYGLSGALLLSGAVGFHSSICGALMRPTGQEMGSGPGYGQASSVGQSVLGWLQRGLSGLAVLRARALVVFVLSTFVMSLVYHSLTVLLPHYLVTYSGLTATEASFGLSVLGIGSFFSRLASGLLAQECGSLLVYCGLLGINGLFSFIAPLLLKEGVAGSYAYCLVVGVYSGGGFSTIFPVLYGLVGVRRSATAFGLAFFMMGLGGMFGAPLTDLVRSNSPSIQFLFGFIGLLFIAGSALACLSSVFPPLKDSDTDQPRALSSQDGDPQLQGSSRGLNWTREVGLDIAEPETGQALLPLPGTENCEPTEGGEGVPLNVTVTRN